jgi:cytochrome c oxidase subunit 3
MTCRGAGRELHRAGCHADRAVWFGDAIRESEGGLYSQRIDHSYRWSMGWFIFSEVMFFGAFFGALFYARTISMPWLGDLDHKVIWPISRRTGATRPGRHGGRIQDHGAVPDPDINTALLLTSGVTLTISHHALRAGHRAQTASGCSPPSCWAPCSWASRRMNITMRTPS